MEQGIYPRFMKTKQQIMEILLQKIKHDCNQDTSYSVMWPIFGHWSNIDEKEYEMHLRLYNTKQIVTLQANCYTILITKISN